MLLIANTMLLVVGRLFKSMKFYILQGGAEVPLLLRLSIKFAALLQIQFRLQETNKKCWEIFVSSFQPNSSTLSEAMYL